MEIEIRKAYRRIKELYETGQIRDKTFMQECNPIKHSFELGNHRECVTKCTNVMFSKSENGNIVKAISLDDTTGNTQEDIIYTDNQLNITRKTNIGLTPLRCALMALLSIELNYRLKDTTRIGFIGNGKINLKTLEMITMFHGEHEIVIRGSRKDRRKNKDLFTAANGGKEVRIDDTEELEILNTCDIIICCTTSTKKSEMISISQLYRPKLFIAQDSGYVFDESFRKAIPNLYSDYDEQLNCHYRDEFPFDKVKHLVSTMRDTKANNQKKMVYLYGIALADIIVFEEVILKGNRDKC